MNFYWTFSHYRTNNTINQVSWFNLVFCGTYLSRNGRSCGECVMTAIPSIEWYQTVRHIEHRSRGCVLIYFENADRSNKNETDTNASRFRPSESFVIELSVLSTTRQVSGWGYQRTTSLPPATGIQISLRIESSSANDFSHGHGFYVGGILDNEHGYHLNDFGLL